MNKFKVGDRVRVIESRYVPEDGVDGLGVGAVGTVEGFFNGDIEVDVDNFRKPKFSPHWTYSPYELEPE